MNDKEKQIEEMVKALLEYIKVYGKLHLTVDGIDNTARLFTKFGITKLPEDSVVLTKEEYEKLLKIKENCLELMKQGEQQLLNISKETAEKILNEVGKVCGDYQWFKNLCKQFGVEIKTEEKCKYFKVRDYGYRKSEQCSGQKYSPEVKCKGCIDKCHIKGEL